VIDIEVFNGLQSESTGQASSEIPSFDEVFDRWGPDAQDAPIDYEAVRLACTTPVVDAESGVLTVSEETKVKLVRARFGRWVVSTRASWGERTRDSIAAFAERPERTPKHPKHIDARVMQHRERLIKQRA
jgi:hypothetical protein